MSPKLKGGRAASAPPRRQKPHHSEIEKQREAGTRSVQKELILTEPKEFKLKTSMRGEAHRASFNMALLKAQEEEAKAREVKARPILASVRKSELPLRSASCDDAPVEKCTKVKPFQLLSEARHEDSIQKMRQRASVLNQPLQSDFKALPLPKSTYEPDFVPSIDAIQPVHHDSVVLESDLRAQKRKEFDQSVRAKLEEIERIEEELENQRVEEQNAKMKELRRKSIEEGGLVFKAKPVMKQDKYPTKSVPQTPLTTAKSPFLQTKTRSALRRKSSSTDVYPSDQQLAQALSQM